MRPIIKVENLSKQYVIGARQTPYKTIRESITERLSAPFNRHRQNRDSRENTIWALKDVSFEIWPGEVVGVIGRNGAGKSTLLKILSRITEPTDGEIDLYGRICSLLEVGTGFHPELTGRENIFLNGAVLGMRREEIKRRFDEIVSFAEVEKFIDTPVKRYSSGMYLRLAFAVAAYLEPEILVVDEVLAVGDAEFQKKCLGKMSEVAGNGRTVLFVSHNMAAVRGLCRRALLLKNGTLALDTKANIVIESYLQSGIRSVPEREWPDGELPGNEQVRVKRVAVYADNKLPHDPLLTNDDVVLEVEFYNNLEDVSLDVTWDIMDEQGTHVAHIGAVCYPSRYMKRGRYRTIGVLPKNILNAKRYILSVQWGRNQQALLYRMDDILVCDVSDNLNERGSNFSQFPGAVHPKCKWKTVCL